MKIRSVLALIPALSATLWATYTYDYSKSPVIADSSRWQANGTATFASYGATFPGIGGSMISIPAISGSSPWDGEVNATLALKSGGGTYFEFFRASSTTVAPGGGYYLSVELTVPSNFAGSGAATLAVNELTNGSLTQLTASTITAMDGMSLRSVVYGGPCWFS